MRLSALVAATFVCSAAPAMAATLHPERVVASNIKDFDVATNGDVILTVWTDTAAGVVRGTYFDASTAEPTGAAVAFPSSPRSYLDAAVASDGDGFLIAWVNHGLVRATRVTAAGTILGPELVLDSEGPYTNVDAEWNGSMWLVAWTESISPPDSYSYGSVRAARISAGFELLDAERLTVLSYAAGPTIVAHGEDFLVLVGTAVNPDSEDDPPALRVVHPDGSRTGRRATVETREDTWQGGIASDGTEVVRIYRAYNREGLWIAALAAGRERHFSVSDRRFVRASFASGRFLVAWDEGVEIRASRMTAGLRFLDGAAGQKILGRSARLAEILDLGEYAIVYAWRGNTLVSRTIRF